MPTMAAHFAEEMKAAREAKGYTKYRLAKVSGVSDGLLSRFESGKQLPADETVEKIAKALDVEAGRLLAAAAADRVGDEALDRIAEMRSPKHNNDARLRQLHELPILNNSLGIMSDNGSVIPITNGLASGNHGAGELRPAEFVLLPLYGPAACGSPPSWSFDDTEERYPVPRIAIEHTRASAVFKVSGDSMEAERIRDGDFVMVRPYSGEAPRHGDIVIVESEGGYVCKMYRKSLLGAYLESRYADKDPEIWKPADEARPVGLVVGVVNMNLYGGRR